MARLLGNPPGQGPSGPGLSRRSACLAGLAAALGPWGGEAAAGGVSEREIVLGQIIDLTGPLARVTPDIVNAAQAWFDGVNRQGGLHGRAVRLVTLDDGYVPANSVKAVRKMIDEVQAFALLNMTGTGNVTAVQPLLDKAGLPLFGPITGAENLRTPTGAAIFHLRASYADEIEKIVAHLDTLRQRRIAMVYLDNGFGQDGLASMQKALARRGMRLHAQASMRPDASDADVAVQMLHESRPDAVVLVTTGKATVDFVQRYNAVGRGMRFYALSVMGSQATVQALGPDGVGMVVTSVVPLPWSRSVVAAQEYRAAMQRSGFGNLSFGGFEAFLNAKAMTEGLRRAGRELTVARFIQALESMGKVDLGGFEIGFAKGSREGSRFVELTYIGRDGRFMR